MQILKSKPRDRRIVGISGRIKASIVTETYVHVGSGLPRIVLEEVSIANDLNKAIQEISKKIVRDASGFVKIGGKIVIPGSSVKGNVRSRIELSFKPKDGKIRSCFIRSSPPIKEPKIGQHGWRHYRIWRESLQFDRRSCNYTKDQRVCLICDIFGTEGLQSLVFFSDFVGDCRTETVEVFREKTEAVPPNSRFTGDIVFRNLKLEEIGLLLIGMGIRGSRIGKPVLLGKYKYRDDRFGVVRYEIEEIEFLKPIEQLEGSVDEKVQRLVELAMKEFGDELLDIDEVGEVRKLET